MAWVGLLVPSVEVVQSASFIVIFPITFIANTFVPSQGLPGPLRTIAEWNPVSAVTQAARELFGNVGRRTWCPDVWASEPGALHAHLGAPDPGGVHPAVAAPVPADHQPLTPAGHLARAGCRA
jgi:hypothetical protein